MLGSLSRSHSKWQSFPGYKPTLPKKLCSIPDSSHSHAPSIPQRTLLVLISKYIQKLIICCRFHPATPVPAMFLTCLTSCGHILLASCTVYSWHRVIRSPRQASPALPFASHQVTAGLPVPPCHFLGLPGGCTSDHAKCTSFVLTALLARNSLPHTHMVCLGLCSNIPFREAFPDHLL